MRIFLSQKSGLRRKLISISLPKKINGRATSDGRRFQRESGGWLCRMLREDNKFPRSALCVWHGNHIYP
jgi:hypothetical protein